MPVDYKMNKTNLCFLHKSEKTYFSSFTCLHAVNLKSILSIYCEVSQLKGLTFQFVNLYINC